MSMPTASTSCSASSPAKARLRSTASRWSSRTPSRCRRRTEPEETFSRMNIALLLEMAAEAAPDRVGLVCDGKRWTYAELLSAARGAFELIEQSGAQYVALLDESSEAAVIALFGAALAGVPY